MTTSYDASNWYAGDLKVARAAITNLAPDVGTNFLGVRELDPRFGKTANASNDPHNPTCWVDWTLSRWITDSAFESEEPIRRFLLSCYIHSEGGARWVQERISAALKTALETANGTEDRHTFVTEQIQPPQGYNESGTAFEVSVFTVPCWGGITK